LKTGLSLRSRDLADLKIRDTEKGKMGKRAAKLQSQKQIARAVKQRVVSLIAFLTAILLILILGIGESRWPAWVTGHRTQAEGIIVLAAIVLILLSPIMMEAASNTRTLSGPGKNPKGPRLE
jgi:anaerobic C4-dicarboxylate transporter